MSFGLAIVGFVYAFFSWLGAGRVVAAATGAKPADRTQYPRLYHVVETVAIAAGLPGDAFGGDDDKKHEAKADAERHRFQPKLAGGGDNWLLGGGTENA